MARLTVQHTPHDQAPQAGSSAAQCPPQHAHADACGAHAGLRTAAASRRPAAQGLPFNATGGADARVQEPCAVNYAGSGAVGAHCAAALHEHTARVRYPDPPAQPRGEAGAGGRGRDYGHYRGQSGLQVAEAGAAHHEAGGWDRWGGEGYTSPEDDCNNSADEDDKRDGGEGRGGAGMACERSRDETELENILKKERGFRIKRMEEDGNCLFRAIADQIYGDSGMHAEVRRLCMDYLEAERSHFSQFVTQDFDTYVRRKRHDKIFGNNLEMQAIAELFNRPIEVYCDSAHPMKILHDGYTQTSDSTPLRLSYHRGNHYNSVVNPQEHTVGEGLGIPMDRPRSPHDQIAEACEKITLRESEQADLEEAMLESILRASRESWEQTQIQSQLEQMSIRESRHDYYHTLQESSSTSITRGGGSSDFCAAGGRSFS